MLWDGGVYDNLGLDPLFKIGQGFSRELDQSIDFLIVSNAGASIQYQKHSGHISISNLRRLLDIATNQVGELRSQQVFSSVVTTGRGMYLKMGLTCDQIAQVYSIPISSTPHLLPAEVAKVKNYPTTLNSPTEKDFDLIFRHGYENAKCVHMGLAK